MLALTAYGSERVGFDGAFYSAYFAGEHDYLSASQLTSAFFSSLVSICDKDAVLVKTILIALNSLFLAHFFRRASLLASCLAYVLLVPFLMGNYKLGLSLPFALMFVDKICFAREPRQLFPALLWLLVAILIHAQNLLLIPILVFSPQVRAHARASMTLLAGAVFILLFTSSGNLDEAGYLLDYATDKVPLYFGNYDFYSHGIEVKIAEVVVNIYAIFALLKLAKAIDSSRAYVVHGAIFYHLARSLATIFVASSHVQGRLLVVYVLFEAVAYKRLYSVIAANTSVRRHLSAYVFLRGIGSLAGSLQDAIF